MKEFVFKGEWGFEINVSDIPEIQSSFKFKFEDDLSEELEPLQSQKETYSFIIENIKTIEKVIQERCSTKEERLPENFNLGLITILMSSREDLSYFLVGKDEDIQFLMYQNDILYIDRLGNKFKSVERAIEQNEGTLIGKNDFIPKKFLPCSKYGKLKPAHKNANDTFEYNLIRFKHNELFKELIKENEIEVNHKYKNGSLLASACFMNNNDLVSFLLQKGAKTEGALHSCSYWNNNKEAISLIIEKGTKINFQNDFGWTVLHQQASELASFYMRKNQEQKAGRTTHDLDEKIEDRKKTIAFLLNSGADQYILDSLNRNVIQVATHLTGDFKKEIEIFFSDNEKADNKG